MTCLSLPAKTPLTNASRAPASERVRRSFRTVGHVSRWNPEPHGIEDSFVDNPVVHKHTLADEGAQERATRCLLGRRPGSRMVEGLRPQGGRKWSCATSSEKQTLHWFKSPLSNPLLGGRAEEIEFVAVDGKGLYVSAHPSRN